MPDAPCAKPRAFCPLQNSFELSPFSFDPRAPCPLLHALCSMLHALCPLPPALCPLPSAHCPLPHALCPMRSALSPLRFGCRHHRLPQADTAVIGRHLLVGEYLKFIIMQGLNQPTQQGGVLKTAPAQHDTV
jgi:hypothetical protein